MAQLAYISTYKLFGGFYGAEVLLPAVHIDPDTDIGLNESEGGVGDLIISPLFIQWTDHELLGMHFWHRLNFIFMLPTGQYDRNADVNPGSNSYHFNPYYAGTLDITPRLSASFRLHYL